jgi:hypothetical protein
MHIACGVLFGIVLGHLLAPVLKNIDDGKNQFFPELLLRN